MFIVFLKKFAKNKSALFGLCIILLLFCCAIFAPFISSYDPIEQNLDNRLIPPFWHKDGSSNHILGTDDFGRDLFSRIVHGSRISLFVGFISTSIAFFVGCFLGAMAGYFGGKIDMLIMRIVDIMLCIPSILLAIIIVAILGPSLFNAMIAIGIVGIPSFARLLRAQILGEKEQQYVIASKLNGSSHARLIFKVILPNCIAPVVVQFTMGFASAVIEAAGLSFLGLGAQPPTAEWGAMLSDGFSFISSAYWIIVFPGIAIFLTVMGFNLAGDGLMDTLDPKIRDL